MALNTPWGGACSRRKTLPTFRRFCISGRRGRRPLRNQRCSRGDSRIARRKIDMAVQCRKWRLPTFRKVCASVRRGRRTLRNQRCSRGDLWSSVSIIYRYKLGCFAGADIIRPNPQRYCFYGGRIICLLPCFILNLTSGRGG